MGCASSTFEHKVAPAQTHDPLARSINPQANAISAAFLLSFAQHVSATHGDHLTTQQVVDVVVKPLTAATGLPYVQHVDLVQTQHVSHDYDFFISHTWNENFQLMVSTIMHHMQSMKGPRKYGKSLEQVFIWMDIFVLSQHRKDTSDEHTADQYLLQGLQTAVAAANTGTLVCLQPESTDGKSLFTRAWCLYEMIATLDIKGQSSLVIETSALTVKQLEQLYGSLDISTASTTYKSDQDAIMAAIQKRDGGVDKVNKDLKELLLVLTTQVFLCPCRGDENWTGLAANCVKPMLEAHGYTVYNFGTLNSYDESDYRQSIGQIMMLVMDDTDLFDLPAYPEYTTKCALRGMRCVQVVSRDDVTRVLKVLMDEGYLPTCKQSST